VKENKPKLFKDLIIKQNRLVSVTNEKYLFQNRQCFSKTYRPNRAIFIFSYKNLLKNYSFLGKSYPYIMSDLLSLGRDTVNHFKLAKKYFKRVHE